MRPVEFCPAVARRRCLAAGHALAVTMVLAAALAGCGDDGTATGSVATVDPRTLTLLTDPGAVEWQAGQPYAVQCRAFAPAKAGAPAGALGPEVALPAAATVDVELGPAAPLSVQGTSVRLTRSGSYVLRCRLPALSGLTAQPATVEVVPGPAVTLDTQLLSVAGQPVSAVPPSVVAGAWLGIGCSGADAWGNAVEAGLSVQVEPAQAAPPSALQVQATHAGPLAVACRQGGFADPTPLALTVEAAVPRHLFTVLQPQTIVAGNAAALSCVANDAYGNVVVGFPFALDYPAAVQIKGLYATASQSGAHTIRCVPETLAWDLFTLHPATLSVLPGPPAQLMVQAVPAKPVYKQDEKVQFISEVRDGFGNLIPNAVVDLTLPGQPKPCKLIDAKSVKCAEDGSYDVLFTVAAAPQLQEQRTLVVDGTPPQLTITYPPWGSTLQGKPSVAVQGTAGDQTSGIQSLTLNGKPVFVSHPPCQSDADCSHGTCQPLTGVCSVGSWVAQYGAMHGLNRLEAVGTDAGGSSRKATRGFYFSGKYWPVDSAQPDAALVPEGLQVFLGKDFLDDGNHDPAKPDDLATIIELAIGAMDLNALIPGGGLSSGSVEVKLSNLQVDKPKIGLQPIDGGIRMQVVLTNFKTDLAVKASQKIGPLTVGIKVSGDLTIAKLTIDTQMAMAVQDGVATASVQKTSAQLDGMKLHVDGIGGLFDFLWNILLNAFKGQITDQLVQALDNEVPKLVGGLLGQFAINQAVALPALLPGQPPASIQLVSKLQTLKFSPVGGLLALRAGFVAAKGTPHTVLGSIARSGCIGTIEDKFALDQGQRLQLAIHDDVLNQALHAVWLSGALKLAQVDLAALAGSGAAASPLPLDGATLDLDLFLPPILETCASADPMKLRLQVGDAYAKANLPLGDPPLSLGFFASLDVGATLGLLEDAAGKQKLQVALGKDLQWQLELASITPGYESSQATFEGLIAKLLQDQLAKGLPGLDQLQLDLPSLDIGGLIPGLPGGSKIGLQIKKLHRQSGYTAIDAGLQ